MSKDLDIGEEALHKFATRIKQLRQERNISMEKLSPMIGLSRSAMSMYETAKRMPDLKVLMTYSRFFGVPADYLLGKTNVRDPLYQVACFSNLSTKDFGMLSKKAQKDIKNFIADVMARELKDEE